MLHKEGLVEGLFLVRESNSSLGDFVLRHNMDTGVLNLVFIIFLSSLQTL